jgi:hypothetical protein
MAVGLVEHYFIHGISFDSFEHPNRLLSHALGGWFTSVRDYLSDSGFGLTKPLYTVSTRRKRDKVLMDEVLRTVHAPTKIQQIKKRGYSSE